VRRQLVPAFAQGQFLDTGMQGVQTWMPQLAVEDHRPRVQRHRVGQRPDDDAGCDGAFGQGQDGPAVAVQVLHGLVQPFGVQVSRGRQGPECRQEAEAQLDPLRRPIVAALMSTWVPRSALSGTVPRAASGCS